MPRLVMSAAFLLLCSACGHFVDQKASLDAYHNTPVCCASFAELPFEKLSYPADVDFSIDEKSPLFDFPGSGRSYFKAFELPTVSGPYRLELRSYVVAPIYFGKTLTFYPLITFLDADRHPIRTSTSNDSDLRCLRSKLLDEPGEDAPVQIAEIVEPRTPARYIVIHTSRASIEFGGAYVEPVQLATSAPIFIPMPGMPYEGPIKPGSPVGLLKLRLEAPGR